MYDWKEIIEDKVPCYFYNSKPASNCNKKIGRLIAVLEGNGIYHKFTMSDDVCTIYCEPIRTEDKEKYAIKEKEKVWRPCKNWEEFRNYFGKIAKHKDFNIYRTIDVYNTRDSQAGDYWFYNYTLEDGSSIGVEEEIND